MSADTSVQPLIIGAGIAGLTLGIALRDRGIEAEICEAAPELRPLGAGIWMAPNAMQIFGRLGLAQPIIDAGAEVERVALLDCTESVPPAWRRCAKNLDSPSPPFSAPNSIASCSIDSATVRFAWASGWRPSKTIWPRPPPFSKTGPLLLLPVSSALMVFTPPRAT